MKNSEIDKVELVYLQMSDYLELKDVMQSAYSTMPDQYWREKHIAALLEKFPEGQVVIKVNDHVAGCALSIIVDYGKYVVNHSYKEITANYTFNSHDPELKFQISNDFHLNFNLKPIYLNRKELTQV